ncbi:MAG TPA: thioredoxin family protein [Pirellulales bacterium]|jgi:peroxiredoxin
MFRALFTIIMSLTATYAVAGEFNGVLSAGDAAPAWTALPGTDGQQHALADLKDKKVVVVVFTCNSCPVARDYEDRIIALAKQNPEELAIVAINVNRGPEDSLAKMTERAKERAFPYLYLADESQAIGRAYGASATPDFFVLSPDRKVVYMGSLDDNNDPAVAKANYVGDAVQAALAGTKPATAETFARGCGIRYARQRAK